MVRRADMLRRWSAGVTTHEAGPRMWVPYAILAIASIAIGVIGFAFEAELHHILGEYLADSFGIHDVEEESDEADPNYTRGR